MGSVVCAAQPMSHRGSKHGSFVFYCSTGNHLFDYSVARPMHMVLTCAKPAMQGAWPRGINNLIHDADSFGPPRDLQQPCIRTIHYQPFPSLISIKLISGHGLLPRLKSSLATSYCFTQLVSSVKSIFRKILQIGADLSTKSVTDKV